MWCYFDVQWDSHSTFYGEHSNVLRPMLLDTTQNGKWNAERFLSCKASVTKTYNIEDPTYRARV